MELDPFIGFQFYIHLHALTTLLIDHSEVKVASAQVFARECKLEFEPE